MEVSDPKLISPLLDGFLMGQPMSDHHGVRCCPAIQADTDERYIVKVVSIPASQVQLDAMLLTGACTSEQQAKEYFKELTQDVTDEINILRRLSKLEGFLPFQGTQVEEMDSGIGYEIYLLSPYRRSLKKQMVKHPLTHLDAVNLGLDMCAALAISRRAGYLYVDLCPDNIYVTETQGYRIGDLGFLSLGSLPYASLPEKYRSEYTAPEIADAMSSLNDTLDIYALGLVLYQVYNNGKLPFEQVATGSLLPPPLYADYEMADIILKACAADPKDRWADPAQMGQALVNYMQRNEVNNTPIVPLPPEPIPEEQEEALPSQIEEEDDDGLAELLALIPDEEPPMQEDLPEEAAAPEEPVSEDIAEAAEPETEDAPIEIDEPAETDNELLLPIEEEIIPDEEELTATDEEEISNSDDSAESSDPEEPEDDLTQMLAQVDDLISHQLPDPVVVPDPIDIPIPPPIILEQEDEPEEEPDEESVDGLLAAVFPNASGIEAASQDDTQPDSDQEAEKAPERRSIPKLWIGIGIAAIVIALLAYFCSHYYYTHYLQTIDSFHVIGSENEISVSINSDIDESLLTVICTDTYGNTKFSAVNNGTAVFRDLNPNTHYRIHVEISGNHKLRGPSSGSYTTSSQTRILDFTATIGPEDGSVVLNYTADGPEPDYWCLEYSAKDIPARTIRLDGRTVTVTGLTIGANYTFRLVPGSELYLTGNYALNYTVPEPVIAQNPTITACGNGSLTVVWTAPAGVVDQAWRVRCYNNSGYDQIISSTQDNTATFTGLDHTTGYTVTISAVGVGKSVSTSVTANPITVTDFHTERTAADSMTLTWDFTGNAPTSGWILRYSVDGGAQQTMECATNQAAIPLTTGSTYSFEVQPADDVTYFSSAFSYGPVSDESAT